MVYKKYIKRGGKTYGPYLYKSVKKDGRVITEYLGNSKESSVNDGMKKKFHFSKSNLKVLSVILGIIFVALLIYLIISVGFGTTGKVSSDIQSVYVEGQNLKGQVNLILKNGELFPSDSQVIIDNAGKANQYLLSSLISNEKVIGNFYVEGKNVSGVGDGYGIPGTKEVFPIILFSFKLIPSFEAGNVSVEGNVSGSAGGTGGAGGEFDVGVVVNGTPTEPINNESVPSNKTAPVNETPVEPTLPSGGEVTPSIPVQELPVQETTPTTTETPSATTETPTASEPPAETPSETPSESTSASVSITGEAIEGDIIEGIVSKNSPYEYVLTKGMSVEIVNSSQLVSFEIIDGKAIITTDYSEMEEGYGQEFMGDEKAIFLINLSALNITAKSGVLRVSFVYQEIELTSSTKEIKVIAKNISVQNVTAQNLTNLTKEEKINKLLEKKIKAESRLADELRSKEKVRVIIKTKKGLKSIGDELDGLEDFEVAELDEFNIELLDEMDIEEIVIDQPISLLLKESENIIKSINVKNEFNLTGQGKKICIIDTGVDSSVVSYSTGWDFVNNDSDASDDNGHGTEVAYIAKSVAPGTEIIVAKVLDASGNGYESNVLEGLQWCVDNGANIISFSIGSGNYDGFCDSNVVADLANKAVANGIFVAAATGNDGTTNLKSPACASNVARVSATDKQDNIASFSNVNEALDVFAPGKDISTQTLGGSVTTISGTSASAPFVAGGAALVLQNESLTPLDLRYRLASTGKPILYSQGDLIINISRLDTYNAIINNITMIPYNITLNQTNITNITYTILQSPMAITLTNPINGFVNNSYPTNINFSCDVVDSDGIANISLYTNISGSWILNQTKSIYSEIANVTDNYNVTYLGNGIYRMTFQPSETYSKDSWLYQSNPDSTNDNDLVYLGWNNQKRPVFEFNLSKLLEINKSVEIINASFEWVRATTGGYNGNGSLYSLTGFWYESDITWNNAPSAGLVMYDTQPLPPSIGQSVSYNVSLLAKEWFNGTHGHYGFVLVPNNDGSFSSFTALHSSNTGTSSNRPKFTVYYKFKTADTASFVINNIGQGAYVWNCLAADVEGVSSFAPSNFSFYVDPCLPPTVGDWNIAQSCTLTNKVVYLAQNKSINVNSAGNLTFINTTLWINQTSGSASNINVIGGNLTLLSNSQIRSINNFVYSLTLDIDSKFRMNDSLLNKSSLNLYGQIVSFDNNTLISSPSIIYTGNTTLRNSVFDKSSIRLADPEDGSGASNDLIENNRFITSPLTLQPISLFSNNHTIANNTYEGAGTFISLGAGSDNNTIINNTYNGTATFISIASQGHQIIGNTVKRASRGVSFSITGNNFYNNISDNIFMNITTFGIEGPNIGLVEKNSFYRNQFINNPKAVSLGSVTQNNLFIDSSIINSSNLDIQNAGNNNTFINTTFNKSKVSVTGGYINVFWYLDVSASTRPKVPLSGVNVTGWNASNYPNGQTVFSELTDSGGLITRKTLQEYMQNSTGSFFSTNYTINSTITGYNNYSTQLNITSSTLLNIFMNSVPNISNVVLNSTSGSNSSSDNLTVFYTSSDTDGDILTTITDWRLNAKSLAILNMPFDTNVLGVDSTVKDYSQFQNNGTLGNGTLGTDPSWNSSGRVGGGYEFFGGNSIKTNNNLDLSSTDKISVEFWMKPRSNATFDDILLEFSANYNNNHDAWLIYFNNNTNNKLEFCIRYFSGAGSSYDCWRSSTNLIPNQWYHVVGVFDRSLDINESKGYINGILDGSNSLNGQNDASGNFGNHRLYFGSRSVSPGPPNDLFFNGTIDEVKIWNRSLSADQIREIYNAGLAGKHPERIVHQETSVGDNWSMALTPNDNLVDGTTYLTYDINIVNSAPNTTQVILNSTYGTNRSNESLNCYANISDPEDLFVYANYSWYNDTGLVLSGQSLVNTNAIALASTLTENYTKKYDNWTCSIQAYDGTVYEGDWTNSSKLFVLNTPPTVNLISPPNFNSTINRTPMFTWDGFDPDGESDIKNYTFNITLQGGGAVLCSDSRLLNITQESYVIGSYLKCLSDDNYYYNWTVRAWDGEVFSTWAQPRRINIQSFVSVNLTRDIINFGVLLPNEANDTADNNPLPFLLENIGNVFVNVSINGTDLWTTASNPSQYYRYKIDNSSELGSFNWQLSKTSWRNVTNSSTLELAIAKFKWIDLTDSAEADIYIQVPPDEGAGIKSSLITFKADYAEDYNEEPLL